MKKVVPLKVMKPSEAFQSMSKAEALRIIKIVSFYQGIESATDEICLKAEYQRAKEKYHEAEQVLLDNE